MLEVRSVGGERGHWRDGRFFDRAWAPAGELTSAQMADPRLELREVETSERPAVRREITDELVDAALDEASDDPEVSSVHPRGKDGKFI